MRYLLTGFFTVYFRVYFKAILRLLNCYVGLAVPEEDFLTLLSISHSKTVPFIPPHKINSLFISFSLGTTIHDIEEGLNSKEPLPRFYCYLFAFADLALSILFDELRLAETIFGNILPEDKTVCISNDG